MLPDKALKFFGEEIKDEFVIHNITYEDLVGYIQQTKSVSEGEAEKVQEIVEEILKPKVEKLYVYIENQLDKTAKLQNLNGVLSYMM